MFIKARVFFMLVPLVLVVVMGCAKGDDKADTSAGEVDSAVGETAGEVVSSFKEMKSTYLGAVKAVVKDWDGKIDTLVEAKDALPAAAQLPFEEPIRTLLSSRDEVSKKLSAVESSTEDSFEAKRSDLDLALQSLSGKYETVSTLF